MPSAEGCGDGAEADETAFALGVEGTAGFCPLLFLTSPEALSEEGLMRLRSEEKLLDGTRETLALGFLPGAMG